MAYFTPLDQGSYAKKLRLIGASDGTLENEWDLLDHDGTVATGFSRRG